MQLKIQLLLYEQHPWNASTKSYHSRSTSPRGTRGLFELRAQDTKYLRGSYKTYPKALHEHEHFIVSFSLGFVPWTSVYWQIQSALKVSYGLLSLSQCDLMAPLIFF